MESFQFYRQRNLGEMVRDVFRFVSLNIKEILNYNSLFVLIVGILFYLIVLNFQEQATMLASNESSEFQLQYLTIFLLYFALGLHYIMNVEYFILKEENVEYAFKRLFQRCMKMFSKYLLWLLQTILIMIPGIIILIIPILNFYILISLMPLLFVLRKDGLTYFDAIKECFRLVKGRWWRTLGAYYITAFILTISSSLIYLLAIPFIFLYQETDVQNHFVVMTPVFVAMFLGVMIVSTVMNFVPGIIYYSYKENEQDLINRISKLGDE